MVDTISMSAAVVRPASRPGDLGRVTAQHGELYGREKGMDQTMEAYVASGLAELAIARDRDGDRAGRLWVAEAEDGRLVGSIGMTASGPGAMRLRWFLLDPSCRGQGLGRRMRDLALDHAEEQGCDTVFLWTIDGLAAAHHLYRQAGFALVESVPVHKWGIDAVEQRFELRLRYRVR